MSNFEYRFSGEMAKEYGTDEAIMLYNLAYWVKTNTAVGRNIRDGRVWTYNTQSAFVEIFDFWSKRQIQRILKNLEEKGAIIKGNFNSKPMDRTLWYTVSDEVLEFYGIPLPPVGVESTEMDVPSELVSSIARNGVMDNTEPCAPKHQTVSAIPNIKPDNKPDKHSARVNQEAQFKTFWDAYPRKEGKKKALEKWKRLNPDPELFGRIMAGLDRALRSEQWRRGVIPHPTTWLNGERWEDDLMRPDLPPFGGGPERIDPGEGCEYV